MDKKITVEQEDFIDHVYNNSFVRTTNNCERCFKDGVRNALRILAQEGAITLNNKYANLVREEAPATEPTKIKVTDEMIRYYRNLDPEIVRTELENIRKTSLVHE